MKYLSIFAIILFSFACGNTIRTDSENSNVLINTSSNLEPIDNEALSTKKAHTVDTLVCFGLDRYFGDTTDIGEEDVILSPDYPPSNYPEAIKFIEFFVSKQELEIFRNAPDKYASITTDTALIKFYLNDIKTMVNAVYGGMHKSHPIELIEEPSDPAYAWKWITKLYPYLYTEWMCSECESEAFVAQTELVDKAENTKGKLDDIAFSLPVEHNLLGHGNAGCDYCGYWTFGDGSTSELIREVIVMEKESDIFDDELKSIVYSLMEIDNASVFGVSKNEVLAEISTLEKLQDSTKFDLSNIHKLKEKISALGEKIIYEANDAEDFE